MQRFFQYFFLKIMIIQSRVPHAPERVPIFYYRVKTRVQMFYFDSNTTVSLQCVALVVWKAYVDRMSFG